MSPDGSATASLRCAAPAKINLCLFVGPTRPDGRHQLVTVFQPLDLVDEIHATSEPSLDGDVVECPGVSGENLAATALAAYRDAVGWDGPPIRLRITKRIPIAGGMAGGSADAAAALRIAAAFAGDTDRKRLAVIGERLGADVPSQVLGRRSSATGAGEVLRRSTVKPDWDALVIPIDAQLSAGAVYAKADQLAPPRSAEELEQLEKAVRAAEAGSGVEGAGLAINDLQNAARALCPAIDPAIDQLRTHGAEHAFVSGSGPTVVGLFAPGTVAEALLGLRALRPVLLARPELDATLDPPRWP